MDPSLSHRRAKLYDLHSDGKWIDRGTGYVEIRYSEALGSQCFFVRSEEDPKHVILEIKISRDDYFQRQQDTLIVWVESETRKDLALSFQDVAGCSEIWNMVTRIKQNYALDADESSMRFDQPIAEDTLELPPANMSSIDQIVKMSNESRVDRREQLFQAMHWNRYFDKLFELFNACQDLEHEESLTKMFNIFKNFVLWNIPQLYEELFSDANIDKALAVFQYDPGVPPRLRINHSAYINKNIRFKEVVAFNNPNLVAKIHQTHRIQYIKDIVLLRILDDPTSATLSSIICFNNISIMMQITQDEEYLIRLFAKLLNPSIERSELLDVVHYVQELSSTVKMIQPPYRRNFWNCAIDQGIFKFVVFGLSSSDIEVRLPAAEILNNMLNCDPSLLRIFTQTQKPDYVLMELIVNRLNFDPDMGMRTQMIEVLKSVLDPEGMSSSSIGIGISQGMTQDKDEFLSLFYNTWMGKLILPLKNEDDRNESAKFNVIELLCFFVRVHGFRIRYFLLGNRIIETVLKLIRSRHRFLVLAVIRFVRALVAQSDGFYHRHVAKFHLLDPVVDLLLNNGDQYNLLNSALIELFEHIRKTNIKILVEEIATRYRDRLSAVTYVETFKLLFLKYEQNQESNKVFPEPAAEIRRQPEDKRGVIDDEERYFDSEDAEEKDPLKRNSSEEDPIPKRSRILPE